MRQRNPLMDPLVDWIDQSIYPNGPARGPTLPQYLDSPSRYPQLQGSPFGLPASRAMVRPPASLYELLTPTPEHASLDAALGRTTPAMMANPTPEDDPMHGFAPPGSDPSLNGLPGPDLISAAALAPRVTDARIRGDQADSAANAAAFRRAQLARHQEQRVLAMLPQRPAINPDGSRPSPLPNDLLAQAGGAFQRFVMQPMVNAQNAGAEERPRRKMFPLRGRR